MFITILLFFLGFYILIKGSSFITDGAANLARQLNISTWVIGLVIVGIGTSVPEFSITLISNFFGREGIALGTIIGSNTFNILFILGVSAVFFPLTFKERWVKRDLVWNIFAVLAALLVATYSLYGGENSIISRTEGLVLLTLFCVWIYYSLKRPDDTSVDAGSTRAFTLPVVIFMIFMGLVGVIFGGKWVVDGAVVIARDLGLSERLIGLTIIGIGTSLPELVVSLTAACKKQVGIAVGNIIGSNIFDFLMILGFGAVLSPIAFPPELYVDIWVTFVAATILIASMFIGKKATLTRTKGTIFILMYLAYIAYLAIRG